MHTITKLHNFRSSVCVENMSSCPTCVSSLKRAHLLRKDLVNISCDALSRIFAGHHDTLIKQVRKIFAMTITSLMMISGAGFRLSTGRRTPIGARLSSGGHGVSCSSLPRPQGNGGVAGVRREGKQVLWFENILSSSGQHVSCRSPQSCAPTPFGLSLSLSVTTSSSRMTAELLVRSPPLPVSLDTLRPRQRRPPSRPRRHLHQWTLQVVMAVLAEIRYFKKLDTGR